jgi:hypothetical protein
MISPDLPFLAPTAWNGSSAWKKLHSGSPSSVESPDSCGHGAGQLLGMHTQGKIRGDWVMKSGLHLCRRIFLAEKQIA